MTSVRTRSAGRARSDASAAAPSATASTSQRGASRRVTYCAHVGVVVGEHDRNRRASPARPRAPARATSTSTRSSRRRAATASASSTKGVGHRTPSTLRRRAARDPLGRQVRRARAACVTVKRAAPARLRSRRATVAAVQRARAPAPAPGRCRCPRACGRARPRRGGSARRRAAARRRGMPMPVSRTQQLDRRRRAPRSATAISPSKRELEGVGEQVEDDLLPHVAIDVDGLEAAAGSRRRARSPARSIAERKTLASSAVNAPRSVGSYTASMPAGLDAREIEQRVDQLEQPQAVAVDHRERLALAALELAGARAAASSSGPSISVSGVRNSWLTLLKNAVLARSSSASASARWRSSSYECAWSTAVPICAATQIEEVAIVVVEREEAARPGDDESRRTGRPQDREDRAAVRRRAVGQLAPRARRAAPRERAAGRSGRIAANGHRGSVERDLGRAQRGRRRRRSRSSARPCHRRRGDRGSRTGRPERWPPEQVAPSGTPPRPSGFP